MRTALEVRDLFNTDERVTVSVRPGVALMVEEVEASFARHDGDPARNAWTGQEFMRPFVRRLLADARHADEARTVPAERSAVIRCGAWVAFILAFLDAGEE